MFALVGQPKIAEYEEFMISEEGEVIVKLLLSFISSPRFKKIFLDVFPPGMVRI
jgi:hypothetical protein